MVDAVLPAVEVYFDDIEAGLKRPGIVPQILRGCRGYFALFGRVNGLGGAEQRVFASCFDLRKKMQSPSVPMISISPRRPA